MSAAPPAGAGMMPRPLGETMNTRQKRLLLASCLVALFVGALDQTIVSTATPRIVADLGGFNLLSWLFTSYMLTSTIVVPLCGKLSDIYGRKIFLIGGNVIFLVASALCGAAPSMPALIVFRALQGIGGGMIFSSVFATTGDLFPPAERIKYMGLFTGTFSLASILGPTVGGFLTDHGGWRWVFYVNIPFSLIAIPAVWRNLPSRPSFHRPAIDFAGAALMSLGSVSLLLALVWGGEQYAWGSWQIVSLFAGAVVLTGLFIAQEARFPEPILPLHLFKNRTFLTSNLTVFALGMGMFGAMQYLGIYVQTALGASATASGVIATPQSLGLLVASTISGQLISRTGKYKLQTIGGSILVCIAIGFLTQLDLDTKRWQISAYMVVLGVGFGFLMPTMSMLVQNAVAHQYIGVATSANQFFRQIGSVLGIAIFGALLANAYGHEFDDRFPEEKRAQLGPAIVEVLDDPTFSLNPGALQSVERQAAQVPGGPELLTEALEAQKEGVVAGTQLIYLVALFAGLLTLVMSLIIKEIPLRKTFGPPTGAPGGAPARPDGAVVPPAADAATGPAGGGAG